MDAPDWNRIMIYVNLVVGGMGFLMYGLWALTWAQRGAYRPFILNLVSSATIAIFTVEYGAQLLSSEVAKGIHEHTFLFYAIPFVIGVPVVTRLAEYRRDKAREDYAKSAIDDLMGDEPHGH